MYTSVEQVRGFPLIRFSLLAIESTYSVVYDLRVRDSSVDHAEILSVSFLLISMIPRGRHLALACKHSKSTCIHVQEHIYAISSLMPLKINQESKLPERSGNYMFCQLLITFCSLLTTVWRLKNHTSSLFYRNFLWLHLHHELFL